MKTIILNENQHRELTRMFLNERTYPVKPELVLQVKKFLDKTFKKGDIEKFGERGKIENIPIVSIMDKKGNPIKPYSDKDLHNFLIEEFKDMFSSEEERHNFLKQVIKDWYEDKITPNGLLSVSHC